MQETEQAYVGVILAAGKGTRLTPHTNSVPKCLVAVSGELPILHLQLDALSQTGIHDIYIVVGHRADQIKAYTSHNFPNLAIRFIENPEYATTNTFYSLACAAAHIPETHTVLQLNADVVFEPSIITDIMTPHSSESMVAVRCDTCSEEEIKVHIAADGSIKELSKQVGVMDALGEGIGINLFTPSFWRLYRDILLSTQDTYRNDYFEYGIELAIAQGARIIPFDIGDRSAIEIDFPEDLTRARALPFLTTAQADDA